MVVHRFKYLFSGKNSFSTRREERSGKLKTGPCQKNQDVGVCSETGEVSYHTVRDFSLILFLHIPRSMPSSFNHFTEFEYTSV